ncbi:IL12A protein, partial [Cisticola juncidis]|nr:IL12A protein [Cisticola juncidis]
QERGSLGFNCTFEEVDLEDITKNQTNTIRACTAEDPGVKHREITDKTEISPRGCLWGISEDLRAYRAELSSLGEPQLLQALDELMQVRI